MALATGRPALAEGPVVVTLGDSLTAGYGLPPEVGFVAQLDAWLSAQGIAAEVVNASVSGDTTAGGLARVGWAVTPETDAVIVQLGANDFLRGLDPAEARRNLTGIMDALAAQNLPVLVVGVPAPGNYGAGYKREFDAIYPDLAGAHGALLYPDFFAGLRDLGSDDMGRVMQPDGLHPSAEGVRLIVRDIGPAVADLIGKAAARAE